MTSQVSNQNDSYTCVLMLGNCYAAVLAKKSSRYEFISERLTRNCAAATEIAETFSYLNKIPFNNELKSLEKPLVTVIHTVKGWLPGLVKTEALTVLPYAISSTSEVLKETAIEVAKKIADQEDLFFAPTIGLSLGERALSFDSKGAD